ncbi:LuxR C-terminal-related transcriptional regulator [Nocardiopsis alba]|uniref:LuxR C-terminal-related transcriptional regulator n=1 Tax=Nocardiopsis alba TaxID=53437 RepID=UPI00366CBC06
MHLLLIDDARLYAEPLARRLRNHSATTDVVLCSARQLHEHIGPEERKYDAVLVNASSRTAEGIIVSLVNASLTVIALGVEERPERVVDLARAGASGYVPLDGDIDDVIRAARSATRGEIHCPPHITFAVWRHLGSLASHRPEKQPAVHLTRREQEVLALVALGASNQQISRELFIELRTVKNHVHNILRKLGVKRRGEAAVRAQELIGWTAVTPWDKPGHRLRSSSRQGA